MRLVLVGCFLHFMGMKGWGGARRARITSIFELIDLVEVSRLPMRVSNRALISFWDAISSCRLFNL